MNEHSHKDLIHPISEKKLKSLPHTEQAAYVAITRYVPKGFVEITKGPHAGQFGPQSAHAAEGPDETGEIGI